jgi:hypothetical protein
MAIVFKFPILFENNNSFIPDKATMVFDKHIFNVRLTSFNKTNIFYLHLSGTRVELPPNHKLVWGFQISSLFSRNKSQITI